MDPKNSTIFLRMVEIFRALHTYLLSSLVHHRDLEGPEIHLRLVVLYHKRSSSTAHNASNATTRYFQSLQRCQQIATFF